MEEMEDEIIQNVIDEIFKKFDTSKDGLLDKVEARKFMDEYSCISEIGYEVTQEDYERVFDKFDKNKSGFIERNEIFDFIKEQMANSETK